MTFLIIIPTHNEQQYIRLCLESLEQQTFKDFKCVIVNDGSTDGTLNVIEDFIYHREEKYPGKWSFVNRDGSKMENGHQPGAKVVNAFNFGLETEIITNFEIICKFDADIIFPGDYLERVYSVYQDNSAAGMVSGLVHVNKSGKWQFEDISSKNHIRGPVKSYRVSCFQAMEGLRPVLGWDNIDVLLARMHGYEIFTIKDLWVKHLRPTAYKYKHQKARKLGEYFYNIGLDTPLAIISALKSSVKSRSFSEFFIIMKSFFCQKSTRILSSKEIAFIRKLRYQSIIYKLIKK